jgi:signal transduction histidine kinase
MSRLRQVGWALVGAVVTVQSARLAFALSWPTFGTMSRAPAALGVAAGAALVTAGVVQGRRSPLAPGALLAAAGLSWLITAWDNPGSPAWSFLAGRMLSPVWPVLLAHVLLRTGGRLLRTERSVLALAYVVTLGLEGAAAALVSDPSTNGCTACPTDPLLLADVPGVAAAIDDAAGVAGPIWSLLLAVAVVRRLSRSSPAQRRYTMPASVIGGAVLVMVASGYLQAVGRSSGQVAGPGRTAWVAALLLLLALATAWPALVLELTRRQLAGLVVEASTAPRLGGLSGVLGTILREPSVRLLYPRDDDESRFISANGERAEPRAVLTPIVRECGTVAFLDHRRPLASADVRAILQIARLSLDHERLHAQRQAQLRELRESRGRIVAAAGRERLRLERDLHDGAQQQLVSLAIALQLAEMHEPTLELLPGPVPLADAAAEVAAALSELRSIARGLYPRELADEGLESALETFAESDPTPLDLDVALPRRARSEVESAAFFAVATLLATRAYTSRSGRSVRGRVCGGRLQLDLCEGDPTDLLAVEDRVGAVGGTVERAPGGQIRIELPCA